MKVRVAVAGLLALGSGIGLNTPAMAIGCLSGGVAGAVAGHMAHHGVLGAIGGCIAGHEYHKHQERQATQNRGAYVDQRNQRNDTDDEE
jgi:H+/Cl- antiporter ClcA